MTVLPPAVALYDLAPPLRRKLERVFAALELPVAGVVAPDHSVISGGGWVTRDLVANPSYEITVEAGTGIIERLPVSWPYTTVTTPAQNALIVVDSTGTVRAIAANTPETIPADDLLLLCRTYVDIPTYGARIYAVIDSRTYARTTPAHSLQLQERVVASQVTSGPWAGATALNDIGDINWYFGNIGLYPFVEALPAQVQAHLDVQIAQFYGAGGTGSANWTAVHGTTWNNYFNWPFDVGEPRGTWTRKRADSHDSYAATFSWLAARYATVGGPAALTWWDTNVAAIQNALYWNILFRQRLVAGGGGYLTDTFQDPTIYTVNQSLDNIEVYRGVTDALALMTARGGAQATWAAGFATTAPNIALGIDQMWLATEDTLSVGWNYTTNQREANPLTRFYPDFTIGPPSAVFEVPLSSTASIARTRLTRVMDLLNANCTDWWQTRRYDPYPWGVVVAAAVKLGMRWVGEQWLAFVQRHTAYDSTGYFLIHDVGWARYIERLLEGDSTL